MRTINGGVRVGSIDILTKKRLKECARDCPELVNFYPTSDMGPQFHGKLIDMPLDVDLIVVGPNPYDKRTWYAHIQWKTDGGLKVT